MEGEDERRWMGMATTLTRWRESTFLPFDLAAFLPPFLPEIKIEQFLEGDRFVVRAELPGFDPEKQIEITVVNGMLKIHAERVEEKPERAHTEFRYGAFGRTLALPAGAIEESAAATYRDGILEIAFTVGPLKEPGRHITIEVPKEHRTVKPK
jgi:HSP20 family protein